MASTAPSICSHNRGPGHPEGYPGPSGSQSNWVARVWSSKALPYPHGSAGAGEGEAPVRYGRGSGQRTETMVEEDIWG
jgi:hypothetical protein